MSTVESVEVQEKGVVVGYDVSYRGVSHSLRLGETYEGKLIKSRHDAEGFVASLVDAEDRRRDLRGQA